MSKKRNKGHKKANGFLKFLVVFFTLIIILGLAFLVFYNEIVDKLFKKINLVDLDRSQIGISNEALSRKTEEIKTVLFLGTDSGDLSQTGRSDVIMLASINTKKKTLKLISIPRDTYVRIEGYAPQKINHAYHFGGAKLMLHTINTNFDLAIDDYVLVDYSAVANLVDKVGGIDVKLTQVEINHINKFMGDVSQKTGKPAHRINEAPGVIHLDGVQAVAHARNRKADSDFGRQERQRNIIMKVLKKTESMNPVNIYSLAEEMASMVETSVAKGDIIKYVSEFVINQKKYLSNLQSYQNPSIETGTGWHGRMPDGIYIFDIDREKTTKLFHKYIYEE